MPEEIEMVWDDFQPNAVPMWRCRSCGERVPAAAVVLQDYGRHEGECPKCAPAAIERVKAMSAAHRKRKRTKK